MYTEYYENETNKNYDSNYGYEEPSYEEENNNNNGSALGTIIKIAVIILLIGLIIFLLVLIGKNSNKKKDNNYLDRNITELRYAAEDYFFNENRLPEEGKSSTITYKQLKDGKYVLELVDNNKKVCSTEENRSYVTIENKNGQYVLTVKLTCSDDYLAKTYYYDNKSLVCKNCDGKTKVDPDHKQEEPEEPEDPADDPGSKYDPIDSLDVEVSCNNWSKWTDKKINNPALSVKTRTVFKARQNVKTYSNWSDWTTTQLTASDTLEVETKEEAKTTYGETQTTTSSSTAYAGDNKVVDTVSHSGSKTCKDVDKTSTKWLSATQYKSARSTYKNVKLLETRSVKKDGKYVIEYKISYTTTTQSCTTSSGYTTYYYQVATTTNVTYYRSRTISTTEGPMTDYIETLPEGYTKVPGTEKTQYSYKLNVCK